MYRYGLDPKKIQKCSVGWHGENILMEVKMTGGDMTPDELKWHAAWQGEVNIVRSVQDALECLR